MFSLLLLKYVFLFFIYARLCVLCSSVCMIHVCVCAHVCMRVTVEARREHGCPAAGLTGSCELPNVGIR